jgi:serine/threonine protein kinase
MSTRLTSRQKRAAKCFKHRSLDSCTDLLGAGSFGDVFQLCTHTEIVVKICEITDSESNRVMQIEIDIMKACRHPNIVRLLSYQRWDDYTYIFMERCTPLSVVLREEFNEDRLETFITGLLTGVEYLHDHHVMHRDIKPLNLLVNRAGELVITDFGLSLQLTEKNWEFGEAYTQAVCTRWYRPPEVILQMRHSWRVDIWSTGCVIYELVLRFLGGQEVTLMPGQPHTRNENAPENDQLAKILHVLGSPNADEREQLLQCPLREYAASALNPGVLPTQMPQGAPIKYWDLIGHALKWLPSDRSTASELLSLMQLPFSKRSKN